MRYNLMRGYRDYLGVQVIGAWIWDDELKLGIAKEIHYDEAYATVNIALVSLWGLSVAFQSFS